MADFARYYSCSVVQILASGTPYTCREALDMIRWLPDDSAFIACKAAESAKAERDAKRTGQKPFRPKPDPFDPLQWHGWGMDRHLSARVANELANANYLTQLVNTKQGTKVDKPAFVELPGQSADKPSGIALIRAQRDRDLKRG